MNFKAFYCIFNKKIILTIQYINKIQKLYIFIEKTFVVILTENVIINYK